MMLSAINDPDGAQERKKHKLKRREYHNKVCTHVMDNVVKEEISCNVAFSEICISMCNFYFVECSLLVYSKNFNGKTSLFPIKDFWMAGF